MLRNPRGRDDRGSSPLLLVILIAAVVAVVGGIFTVCNSYTTGQAGYIGVVRNGGPLDNKNIRNDLLPVGAGYTHIGMFSTVHYYPVPPLVYTITSDANSGNKPGVDVEWLPTSDGVQVGLEGTIYLTLNTGDEGALKAFDGNWGVRTFQGVDGQSYYFWNQNNGPNAFLNQVVRPIISNALREEIGHTDCAELQASCVLILQAAAPAATGSAATSPTKYTGTKISEIETAVNAILTSNLKGTLGGSFFVNVRFNLSKVTLTTKAQGSIDAAQAAYADVTKAKAEVQAATQQASANANKQVGYNKCPTCAQIDMLKALPAGITTYAPGAGISLAVPGTAPSATPAKK